MTHEKSPAVYIMANRHRGTIYTGVTSDLGSRVLEHRDGSHGGFTAKYGLKTLVWYENHEDMASAITRETRIKTWRRQWKIDLIESINRDWSDLSDNLIHRPFAPPSTSRHSKRANSEAEHAIRNPAAGSPSGVPNHSLAPSLARRPVAFGMTDGVGVAEGVRYFPQYFPPEAQQHLLTQLRAAVAAAPLFTPEMPRTGKPFSVRMTNLGSLGWVSDRVRGYRYQATHPVTGMPWPAIPEVLLSLWQEVADYRHPPEACLVNFYSGAAKMGLHQDRDEQELSAPVVSVSLGDTALFRIGGTERGGKTQSVKLGSGDVLIFGGPARLAYHGIDRLYPGTSKLLKDGGRINLTLRRVTPPE
jgi:alkylated DNA repair protein (DNA oxidative demethylase)